jgi:hypothetical protein
MVRRAFRLEDTTALTSDCLFQLLKDPVKVASTEIQISHDGRSIHSSDPLVTREVGGRYREMLISNKDLVSDHRCCLL